MSNVPLGLKAFLEAIETHCSSLSRRELIDSILGLGTGLRPQERADFLSRLVAAPSAHAEIKSPDVLWAEVDELVDEIRRRWKSLEDGTYWSDYAAAEGVDPHVVDSPANLTDEHRARFLAYLGEADSLYFEGSLRDARTLYEQLLRIASPSPSDDWWASDLGGSFSRKETQARYARCVYETEPPSRRATAMRDALSALETPRIGSSAREWARPNLVDVLEARLDAPPNLSDFLAAWKLELSECCLDAGHGQDLYLEAIEMTDGLAGIVSVAREWGMDRPRGYATWMRILSRERRLRELASAAHEVLSKPVLLSRETTYTRRLAALSLTEAGEGLGDSEVVLEGRRLLFEWGPSEEALRDLLVAAEKTGVWSRELSWATDVLSKADPGKTALQVKALIAAGRLDETFSLVHESGRQSSPEAADLCVAAYLCCGLVPHLHAFPMLRRQLASCGRRATLYPTSEDDSANAYVFDALIRGLSTVDLDAETEGRLLQWAESAGRDRTDDIVSNKRRSMYYEAACIVVAQAERFLADGRHDAAAALLAEYESKYKPYYAFRRRLGQSVSESALPGK